MKIVSKVVYIVILVFLILFNISSVFNISVFGYRTFKVGSGSMEPTLKVNDLILVKKQNNYNVKDIITFKIDDEYITHRLVEQNKTRVVTKGDANNALDKDFSKDKIVGKVIYRFKILNKVGQLFSSPVTFIIFTFISFGLFYLLFIYKKE